MKETIGKTKLQQVESMINWDTLHQAMKWFTYYSITQRNDSNITFTEGWIYAEEGYKESLFQHAHKVLNYDSWDKNMIGTGNILACVTAAFKAKPDKEPNNIVDYRSEGWFKEKALEDIPYAEGILYRLYKDESPANAFDDACKFWGKRYPELSYLLFVRDKDKYVPVRTRNHINRFKKLGINTDCLNCCSWSNYMTYNMINELVRLELENYFGMTVSLLDAHSFIWMLHHAEDGFDCENLSIIDEVIGDQNPYESIVITGGKEGRVIKRYGTTYERNSKNRAEAIRIHGYRCEACGFDFSEVYGKLGQNYIEVHHVKPLCSLTEEVTINPETDLVCLCANCHRMIHRKRGAIMTVEELKGILLMKPFLKA